MSNNWIVENIQNALGTWNDKLNEIWRLLTESPESFKGGAVWNVMVNINGTLKAVGYALLVLFFLMGIMKHYNSFSEVKRPEQAIKLFLRFVLAKAAITWGLDLMMAIFRIVQGVIGKIMTASGIGGQGSIYLPDSMVQTIEDCGFWESIPLWAVTLIGSLLITVLSFVMILTVYGRFFKLLRFHPCRLRPLQVRRRGRSARASSARISRSVWRAQSSCLPASSIRCSCQAHRRSTRTRPLSIRSGLMSGRSYSICWC